MREDVLGTIAKVCEQHGRDPDDIRLLAVSKTFTADNIEPVLQVGHRLFGENRVQEAESKWPPLKDKYKDVELHLIGALQTNKAAVAVRLFDAIHSLDREKLAVKLAAEMDAQNKRLSLFIQVNIGEEPQKAGVDPKAVAEFCDYCRHDLQLPIVGLMAIPPVDVEPSPYFALMQKYRQELQLPHLSMGMSGDYEVALAFGADYVRIGTAIFGSRQVGNN